MNQQESYVIEDFTIKIENKETLQNMWSASSIEAYIPNVGTGEVICILPNEEIAYQEFNLWHGDISLSIIKNKNKNFKETNIEIGQTDSNNKNTYDDKVMYEATISVLEKRIIIDCSIDNHISEVVDTKVLAYSNFIFSVIEPSTDIVVKEFTSLAEARRYIQEQANPYALWCDEVFIRMID